mgnify:CR=1 FL=1
MDGNQKIKASLSTFTILLFLVACSTQKSHYIGLYVDDTVEIQNEFSDELQAVLHSDSLAFEAVNWNFLKDVDTLPLDDFYKKYDVFSNDSVVKLKRNRIFIRTNDLDKSQFKMNDTVQYGNITNEKDALNEIENQRVKNNVIQYQLDDFYEEGEQLRMQNNALEAQRNKNIQQDGNAVAKTNVLVPFVVANEKTQSDQEALIAAQNDTINQLKNQLNNSLQAQKKLDAIDVQNEQLDTQKKLLKTQRNNNNQNRKVVEKRNVIVPMVIPAGKNDNNEANDALLAAKNDTITYLKSQLNTQLEAQNPNDSLSIQKSSTVVPMVVQNKTIDSVGAENKTAINDTKQPVNNKVLAEPKVIQITTVDTVFVDRIVPEIKIETIPSTLFTAFYDLEKTTPNNINLDEVIQLLKTNNVIKVELSGFTDSTGNAAFNKQLTSKRMNYIQSTIKPFVPIEKIFIQNFGQTFASQKSLDEERKVEIRVYLKKEEK